MATIYFSCFSHCCNKTLNMSHLRKEKVILVGSFSITVLNYRKCLLGGARGRWSNHIYSYKVINTDAQNTLYFLFRRCSQPWQKYHPPLCLVFLFQLTYSRKSLQCTPRGLSSCLSLGSIKLTVKFV